jgi:osmotically-inducible protein OsmY
LINAMTPLTDREIERFVREELDKDPRVSTVNVGVFLSQGKVELRGTVPSLYERSMTERIARSVIGVARVDNQLVVEAESRSDEEIRRDIEKYFADDAVLRKQSIEVTVYEGEVLLSGEVADSNSKFHAGRGVSYIRGVRSLSNEISISRTTRLSDATIGQLIRQRLRANAVTRDVAQGINVEVREGIVLLTGQVEALTQITEAQRACYFTNGVRRVDNRLQIAAARP